MKNTKYEHPCAMHKGKEYKIWNMSFLPSTYVLYKYIEDEDFYITSCKIKNYTETDNVIVRIPSLHYRGEEIELIVKNDEIFGKK